MFSRRINERKLLQIWVTKNTNANKTLHKNAQGKLRPWVTQVNLDAYDMLKDSKNDARNAIFLEAIYTVHNTVNFPLRICLRKTCCFCHLSFLNRISLGK